MKCRIPAVLLSAMLLALSAGAATPPAPKPPASAPASAPAGRVPEKLTLAVLWVAYSQPPAYIFSINNTVAYKDLASLERSIADMPAGTTITWAPSDVVFGGEPLRDPKELDAFKKFCEDKNVKLIIIPGG